MDQTEYGNGKKHSAYWNQAMPNQFRQWSVCQSCIQVKAVNKQEEGPWENNTGVNLVTKF